MSKLLSHLGVRPGAAIVLSPMLSLGLIPAIMLHYIHSFKKKRVGFNVLYSRDVTKFVCDVTTLF